MSSAHVFVPTAISVDPLSGNSPRTHDSSLDAAEVVRMMAHELRQPLSTIESIAYYLNLVLPREDGRAREQLSKLQGLVEQSNWILSNGVRCVEVSAAAREVIDFEEIVSEAVCRQSPDVAIEMHLDGSLPQVLLDPSQVRDMIGGLLALFSKGSSDAAVKVTTRLANRRIQLEIASSGRASGQGAGASLGLESARQCVDANGGTLEFLTIADGARITVSFPVFGNDA